MTVVDLNDAEARVAARADFDPLLHETQLQELLAQLAERANSLATENAQGMTRADFETELSAKDDLTRMLDADTRATYAKYGLKPVDTVEGLTALRVFLVDAYRDSQVVRPQTQLAVTKIQLEIAQIEAASTLLINAHRFKAELDEVKAGTAVQVEQAAAGATVASAQADAHTTTVGATSQTRSADIDLQLMDDVKRTERYRKQLANQRELWRLRWNHRIKPTVKFAVPSLIFLTLLSNLVADDPARANTPVLGLINNAWDGAYEPVRDGVVRVYHDIRDEEPADGPAEQITPQQPEAPGEPSNQVNRRGGNRRVRDGD